MAKVKKKTTKDAKEKKPKPPVDSYSSYNVDGDTLTVKKLVDKIPTRYSIFFPDRNTWLTYTTFWPAGNTIDSEGKVKAGINFNESAHNVGPKFDTFEDAMNLVSTLHKSTSFLRHERVRIASIEKAVVKWKLEKIK